MKHWVIVVVQYSKNNAEVEVQGLYSNPSKAAQHFYDTLVELGVGEDVAEQITTEWDPDEEEGLRWDWNSGRELLVATMTLEKVK